MNWKIKAGIASIIILVFCLLIFVVKKQHDTIQQMSAIQNSIIEMKELQDGSVRSESVYASKNDIEKAIKDAKFDPKILNNDLEQLKSEIKGVHTIISKSTGVKYINTPSSKTESNPDVKPEIVECSDGKTIECPDTFGYRANKQILELSEPFSDRKPLPIGRVSFSAWKENPWEAEIYPRNYHVTSIVSVDEDGKQNFHNKFSVETNGEMHELPITSSKFVQEYPSNKFRFDPRFYLGIDAGIITGEQSVFEVSPNLQVAFFTFGKTKKDIDFNFLSIGGGYNINNETISLILSPINYNIGQHIPLMDNLFVGPSFSLDTDRNFAIMFGLRVGL